MGRSQNYTAHAACTFGLLPTTLITLIVSLLRRWCTVLRLIISLLRRGIISLLRRRRGIPSSTTPTISIIVITLTPHSAKRSPSNIVICVRGPLLLSRVVVACPSAVSLFSEVMSLFLGRLFGFKFVGVVPIETFGFYEFVDFCGCDSR